ncbi:MAG: cytochrome P450 [Acidobacteria bacterium]|nr:cytochrome P450 [Acidobacteriota bacterium]
MARASAGTGVPPRRHIQRSVFDLGASVLRNRSRERGTRSIEDALQGHRHPESLERVRPPDSECGGGDRRDRARTHSRRAFARRWRWQFPGGAGPQQPRFRGRPDDRGNLAYILHTTWADVSGLLQWIARMLTDHGQWADRLRLPAHADSAHEGGALSLSTRVVMETLRLEQSEYLYRATTSDVSHGGMVIPKGWLVRLCVRESHQDPAVFEHAQTFDPDRFLHRSFARREYAPFGAGLRHACLGEELTKTVGGIFAEELARGATGNPLPMALPNTARGVIGDRRRHGALSSRLVVEAREPRCPGAVATGQRVDGHIQRGRLHRDHAGQRASPDIRRFRACDHRRRVE